MDDLAPRLEEGRVDPRVLVDRDGALSPSPRGADRTPPPPLLLRERLLLVAGLEVPPLGEDPDLEEVEGLPVRGVELAVDHARPRRHPLDLPGPDDRPGPEA